MGLEAVAVVPTARYCYLYFAYYVCCTSELGDIKGEVPSSSIKFLITIPIIKLSRGIVTPKRAQAKDRYRTLSLISRSRLLVKGLKLWI